MNHLRLDISEPDRVTIWIDVAGRSVNVLSEPVFDQLRQSLEEASRLRPEWPVVLRSAKPKGFVVGADLRRILALETDVQVRSFMRYGQECLDALEQCGSSTVALIEGPCLGGGLELALACRYRVARDTPQTQLGMPEAKLGLMPGWGGTQRLIEIVGVEVGLELLLTSEAVGAAQAFNTGLVDALVDPYREEPVTHFLHAVKNETIAPVRPGRDGTARQRLDQWKRSHTESLSPAQQSIVDAVTAGIYRSREEGLRAERELFFPLLVAPSTREKLQRFAGSERRSEE